MADTIETKAQFDPNKTGQARRWTVEMTAAEENQRRWVERGDRIIKRFVDDRTGDRREGDTRVNLFTANVQTLRALLFGNPPKVDVKRRFVDPNDSQARVAAEILQRLLNMDIERDSDTYSEALERALDDRLLSGLGVARCRYVAKFGKKKTPAIPDSTDPATGRKRQGAPAVEKEVKTDENVEIDYVHWRDFRWSPARTWADVRWIAFRVLMTKDDLIKRFGEKMAQQIPLTSKGSDKKHLGEDEGAKNQAWNRAEVWEIWNKEDRNTVWWVEGYPEILDVKDDALGLDGFFPAAAPMFANLTTTKLIPTPDFTLAQDIYDEIDLVSTRITLLERAVAVRGVYDKTSPEIERILSEAASNQLIPTDNFAAFKEKGGLQSVVDWLPLEQIVGALEVLKQYRVELMNLLFQVTGMSDIMRGQSDQNNVTATEQAIKAKFASTRVQALQNEFARFASDLQKIKAEIISKHYDPKTIYQRSNEQYMTGSDPNIALAAIQIIKSDIYQYRIEVKPESVAMADMAAVKQERSEFLMAMATYLQSSQPIVQAAPWAGPFLLQMLQWAMAGYRGGATVEGVLDQFVMQAQQAAQQAASQPPPPDPKLMQIQAKAQMDQQMGQHKIQMEQQKNQMDIELKKIELQFKVIEKQLELQTLQQKNDMDTQKQKADLMLGIQQTQAEMEGERQKLVLDAKKGAMEQEQAQQQHDQTMEQGRQQHEQSMIQAKEKAKVAPAPKKGGKK